MAKTPKRALGDIGEGVACKYLQNKGFSVVERNYLKPWGEIDVIAEKAEKLYFIEVKSVSREASDWQKAGVTRESDTYRPEENVHPAKLKRLHRAVQTYLLDHKVPDDREWQIDVACVYLDFSTHRAHVEVLENVIL
jgi:putative endonuclease